MLDAADNEIDLAQAGPDGSKTTVDTTSKASPELPSAQRLRLRETRSNLLILRECWPSLTIWPLCRDMPVLDGMKTEQTEKTQEEKLQEIGSCAMSSIVEMVTALDREKAAHAFARDLSREDCVKLLTEASIECRDDETVEDLREAVAVNIEDETIEPEGFEFDEEAAQERISEDPLSLEVRSGWVSLGAEMKPEEFNILLTTGGPAVRIIGELDKHSQPDRPRLQAQDWYTPWTDYRATVEEQEALETYCRQFCFEC